MMMFMSEISKTNNDRLRELVRTAHLSGPVAMTIFNRGLGARACSETEWKGYMAASDDTRFMLLPDALLEHAERQFESVPKKSLSWVS
jgi:hypothetical protein